MSTIPPFSIVVPVKDERVLLARCLKACYGVHPSEVILCFDKPAPADCLRIVEKLGAKQRNIETRTIEVERSMEWKFHQAHVRRTGFLNAKHNRILTTDVDLLVNSNVLKAVGLVGEDNIGLVSCAKTYPLKGILGLWRMMAYQIARRIHFAPFTGLYAIWKPFWLGSEDEDVKLLEDPRKGVTTNHIVPLGEDTYLRNCMAIKHRVIYLHDIGAHCMTPCNEDLPEIQFAAGQYFAELSENPLRVILRSLMYARIHQLRGYLYQKRHQG